MFEKLTGILKTRYNLLLIFAGLNLSAFTLLRGILLVSVWREANPAGVDIGFLFFTGFVYDLVFNIYFSIFFAFILLVVPSRVYSGKIFRNMVFLVFLFLIYGLYFVLIAEWLFFDEFGTRFNFIAVDYLIYRHEVVQNIWESYPVGLLMGIIGVISLATLWGFKKSISRVLRIQEPFSLRLAAFLCLMLLVGLSYAGIGQSLREMPRNNFVKELASSGPYQFVAAFRNNTLDYALYRQGSDDDLSDLLKKEVGKNPEDGSLYDISREVCPEDAAKRLNVILVSVESLSAEFFKRFGNQKDITPFLDQTLPHGLLFTRFYATGTRTTRGLEAITLSMPPTPGRSIVKRPDNAGYYSLGKVFRDRGYNVAFLYGGRGFFDNMNAFFSGNGYDIIDQTDFSDHAVTFKNAWGVCDEDLYNKAVQVANRSYEEKKPFFFHIMTTSNHRPYTYPEGKIDIPSGTGRSGAVKYTDYALHQLITAARSQPWFDDTVFVLVADHCARSAGRVGLPIENYHIPLWIYAPKYITPGENHKIASQIDIAPTLLAMLHFNYEDHFFGTDILADNFLERALIGNYQKLGLFKDNELVILSPGGKVERMLDPDHNSDRIEEVTELTMPVTEAMSYYQGSDYVIKHSLNRCENNNIRYLSASHYKNVPVQVEIE